MVDVRHRLCNSWPKITRWIYRTSTDSARMVDVRYWLCNSWSENHKMDISHIDRTRWSMCDIGFVTLGHKITRWTCRSSLHCISTRPCERASYHAVLIIISPRRTNVRQTFTNECVHKECVFLATTVGRTMIKGRRTRPCERGVVPGRATTDSERMVDVRYRPCNSWPEKSQGAYRTHRPIPFGWSMCDTVGSL